MGVLIRHGKYTQVARQSVGTACELEGLGIPKWPYGMRRAGNSSHGCMFANRLSASGAMAFRVDYMFYSNPLSFSSFSFQYPYSKQSSLCIQFVASQSMYNDIYIYIHIYQMYTTQFLIVLHSQSILLYLPISPSYLSSSSMLLSSLTSFPVSTG